MHGGVLTALVLRAARRTPRGGLRIVRLLARLDQRLERWPITLKHVPDVTVHADLRESVWFDLWRYGSYPWQEAEDVLALTILRAGDVVWDVGANVGYTALVYARAVGPTGRVIAFEPSRRAYQMLERTVASAHWVEPVQTAVSNEEGRVFFRDATLLDRSSISTSSDAGAYSIAVTTLDAERTRHPVPVFLKIDVEGYEHAVLEGALGLIRDGRPMVLFEALSDDARNTTVELLSRASEGNYRVYRVAHDARLLPLDTPKTRETTNNFLAVTDVHAERLASLSSSA
jgi:FkbM family methyltransferase